MADYILYFYPYHWWIGPFFAEQDSEYEDAVKAMSSSILVHYFSPLGGFSVVSEQNRDNHYAD